MLKPNQNFHTVKPRSVLSFLVFILFCAGCGDPGTISRYRCDPGNTYYNGTMCVPYKSPGDQCVEPVYDPACPPKYMCGYKDEPGIRLSISPVFCVQEGLQITQYVAPTCTVYPLKLIAGNSYQTFGGSFILRQGEPARVAQGEKVVSSKEDPNTGVVTEEIFTTEVSVLAYDCGPMSIPPELIIFNGIIFASSQRVAVRQSGKVPGKNGNPDTVYVVDRSGAPIVIDGKSFSGSIVLLSKFGS